MKITRKPENTKVSCSSLGLQCFRRTSAAVSTSALAQQSAINARRLVSSISPEYIPPTFSRRTLSMRAARSHSRCSTIRCGAGKWLGQPDEQNKPH
jgi:hypothetical protein